MDICYFTIYLKEITIIPKTVKINLLCIYLDVTHRIIDVRVCLASQSNNMCFLSESRPIYNNSLIELKAQFKFHYAESL